MDNEDIINTLSVDELRTYSKVIEEEIKEEDKERAK